MDNNERFIHDELLRRAEKGLPGIHQAWRVKQHIDPFIISWPSKHLKGDDGSIITDSVLVELPEDRKRWRPHLLRTVHRTKPYALLLAEELDDCVMVTFESGHGTRSWRWPIKDHGGMRVLGNVTQRDDVDSIGILWSPTAHRA